MINTNNSKTERGQGEEELNGSEESKLPRLQACRPSSSAPRPVLSMPTSIRPILALLLMLSALPAASQAKTLGHESFFYDCRLRGFLGHLAGVVLPSRGQGVLRTHITDQGHLHTELLVASAKPGRDEIWRYGSEIDLDSGRPLRSWSSYRGRGKDEMREITIDTDNLVGLASWIYQMRRDPPQDDRLMKVWWDGQVYPVRVVARGLQARPFSRSTNKAELFEVVGDNRQPGPRLRGRFRLWISGQDSTPLDLVFARWGAKVHFRLREGSRDASILPPALVSGP